MAVPHHLSILLLPRRGGLRACIGCCQTASGWSWALLGPELAKTWEKNSILVIWLKIWRSLSHVCLTPYTVIFQCMCRPSSNNPPWSHGNEIRLCNVILMSLLGRRGLLLPVPACQAVAVLEHGCVTHSVGLYERLCIIVVL